MTVAWWTVPLQCLTTRYALYVNRVCSLFFRRTAALEYWSKQFEFCSRQRLGERVRTQEIAIGFLENDLLVCHTFPTEEIPDTGVFGLV